MPLLEVNHLSIQIKKDDVSVQAVDNISFSILPNQITAIVGESGSGKTITALSIMKLLPRGATISGDIFFELNNKKNAIQQLSEEELTLVRGDKIAMIFQEPMTALNPLISCGNQIMETIVTHQQLTKQKAKEKTIQLLEAMDFTNPKIAYKKYPHQLSGGQRQRVMIAMAISCNPSLLIADEPTTALDVIVQKNILDLLKKIQQTHKMSVLLITHDLGIVADFADHVIIMKNGNILEQGTCNDIINRPTHAYTKALLNCIPDFTSKGKPLPVIDEMKHATIQFHNDSKYTLQKKPESDHTSPILSVQSLKVLFPLSKNIFGKSTSYHHAIDNISFDVFQNEILGIIGESGCGKTTLGKTIVQLIKPTSGKILLKGKNIFDNNLLVNPNNIQIVFQDPYGSLNPRITIGDAISEPIKVHRLITNETKLKERIAELMIQVGLHPNHANKYPHEFSGGQRQRICIARALALEPSILIFDESVSALDVSIQAQILNLINTLKSNYNITSIFISHNISVIHYISDRILVMKDGKIIEEGNPDRLVSNPTHDYTKALIQSIPGINLMKQYKKI